MSTMDDLPHESSSTSTIQREPSLERRTASSGWHRWLRMRGHRAGEPALFAQVIEAVVDARTVCHVLPHFALT